MFNDLCDFQKVKSIFERETRKCVYFQKVGQKVIFFISLIILKIEFKKVDYVL